MQKQDLRNLQLAERLALRSYYGSCAANELGLYDNFRRHTWVRGIDRFVAAWVYRQATSLLPPNPATIVDVGCGLGSLIEYLVHYTPTSRIIGIDFCEELLECARRRFPDCTFQQGDLCDGSATFPSADIIFSLGVINHFSSEPLSSVLKRLSEMTKRRLIISFVPSCFIFVSLVGRFLRRRGLPFAAHDVQRIVHQLELYGMKSIQYKYLSKIPLISPVVIVTMEWR